MALVTCPDCATEISDAAAACTKCGKPTARSHSRRIEHIGAVTAAVGLVLAMLGWRGLGGMLFGFGVVVSLVGRFALPR